MTYEELKASVEKREYERTHRDNQLLEKYRTLPGIKYKRPIRRFARWTARVPVKSCKDAKARRVFVKCTVIGGALDLPILTNFAQPFKSEA